MFWLYPRHSMISQSLMSSQRPQCANLAPAGANAYETLGNRRVKTIFFDIFIFLTSWSTTEHGTRRGRCRGFWKKLVFANWEPVFLGKFRHTQQASRGENDADWLDGKSEVLSQAATRSGREQFGCRRILELGLEETFKTPLALFGPDCRVFRGTSQIPLLQTWKITGTDLFLKSVFL